MVSAPLLTMPPPPSDAELPLQGAIDDRKRCAAGPAIIHDSTAARGGVSTQGGVNNGDRGDAEAPWFQSAPPKPAGAELSLKVLWLIVRFALPDEPSLKIAPPASAEFPLSVQRVTVRDAMIVQDRAAVIGRDAGAERESAEHNAVRKRRSIRGGTCRLPRGKSEEAESGRVGVTADREEIGAPILRRSRLYR
jgi:hypothetical protein